MMPAALSLYRPLPGAKARIVAFPHAGGGASAFRGLATALAAHGIEVCPLQAPGRENRMSAPFHRSAEAMAEEFADAIGTLPLLPTVFLGHSLGGLIAYLSAQRLVSNGAAPRRLVASASTSPLLRSGTRSGSSPASGTLRERIVALGGVPDAIGADPELFELFAPVIQADLDLSTRYVHRKAEPLTCPISVYSGAQDRTASAAAGMGWQELTVHPLHRRTFEGGHFFLYEQPQPVAAALVEDIASW